MADNRGPIAIERIAGRLVRGEGYERRYGHIGGALLKFRFTTKIDRFRLEKAFKLAHLSHRLWSAPAPLVSSGAAARVTPKDEFHGLSLPHQDPSFVH